MQKKRERERERDHSRNQQSQKLVLEKIKLTNHSPDSSRNKGRKIKSIKLEIKMERSQQTTQKYKGS